MSKHEWIKSIALLTGMSSLLFLQFYSYIDVPNIVSVAVAFCVTFPPVFLALPFHLYAKKKGQNGVDDYVKAGVIAGIAVGLFLGLIFNLWGGNIIFPAIAGFICGCTVAATFWAFIVSAEIRPRIMLSIPWVITLISTLFLI